MSKLHRAVYLGAPAALGLAGFSLTEAADDHSLALNIGVTIAGILVTLEGLIVLVNWRDSAKAISKQLRSNNSVLFAAHSPGLIRAIAVIMVFVGVVVCELGLRSLL
jgi:hypothetical protein